VKPILQALVLAEKVTTLADGRKIIIGTFTGVVLRLRRRTEVAEAKDEEQTVTVQGGETGAPWAYLCLTGVVNNTKLELQFVSLKKNAPVFRTEITLVGNSRVRSVELEIPLPHIRVTEPGGYAFDVVCDGEILGSWRVEVEVIYEESEGTEP